MRRRQPTEQHGLSSLKYEHHLAPSSTLYYSSVAGYRRAKEASEAVTPDSR
jgi:hypothetical protein